MAGPLHVDKLLLVNHGALVAKYDEPGAAMVEKALDELVSADAGRGLDDRVLAIDDADAVAPFGITPVTDAGDAAAVKAVVDAVFRTLTPDYLVLVGSVDVIPHQSLANPMPDDGDAVVPSDLPYACEHALSDDPADFIAPTRVVGRIPDITSGTDPAYLVGLLEKAAAWKPFPAADYRNGLAVSAAVWQGSTTLSAGNLFGPGASVELVPPADPRWQADLLGRRSHFFNCHGAGADPHFYGQLGNDFPIAHDAEWLTGRVTAGTVVAVECCYGAELYNPGLAGSVAGICNAYLEQGAYGFCGSSTIAYGPAEGNGSADLLTQYFLRDVLAGASLGRALLQARQAFVRDASIVDPADLKTLAQFHLLGDPSIHPAEVPPEDHDSHAAHGGPAAKAMRPSTRSIRRRNLVANGLALAEATAVARTSGQEPARSLVDELLTLVGVDIAAPGMVATQSFAVTAPAMTTKAKAFGLAPTLDRPDATLHVVVRRPEAAYDHPAAVETLASTFAVVALEEEGRLVSWRRLDAR